MYGQPDGMWSRQASFEPEDDKKGQTRRLTDSAEVLEAGAMGKGSEIYVFEMGESIKIYDLALKMIKLSGLKYPEEMDIKITGLRPGEKIYEELLANGENTLATYNDKIMIAKVKDLDVINIRKNIIELCLLSKSCDNFRIVKKIKEIVPEYISNNSVFEKLDT